MVFCVVKEKGNNKSKFAQHLLDDKHSIGPMKNIMVLLHATDKGKMLNILEKFHIYKETKIDNQLNDKCTSRPNIISDTLLLKDTGRGQSALLLPLSTVPTFSHKSQHSSTHTSRFSTLHKIVSTRTRLKMSHIDRNSILNYTNTCHFITTFMGR